MNTFSDENFINLSNTGGGIIGVFFAWGLVNLFDLNGIYIPLSFFLELLGEAFSSLIDTEITNLVYVSIKGITKVMFDHELSYNKQMWIDQGQTALDQIKISVKFLADFKNIIGSLK